MISAENTYTAVFREPPFQQNPRTRFQVIAWDDGGYALIVDELGGKLVQARGQRGFASLEPVKTSLEPVKNG
jgi:hypothetical protein